MITTKEVKIKRKNDYTSSYIEHELQKMEFDVLRWAITDFDEKNLILNVSYIEKNNL